MCGGEAGCVGERLGVWGRGWVYGGEAGCMHMAGCEAVYLAHGAVFCLVIVSIPLPPVELLR